MQLRELERTRLIGYQIYAVSPKKGQNKPIHQYMPLPSDKLRNKVDPERRKAQREFFINKEKERREKK